MHASMSPKTSLLWAKGKGGVRAPGTPGPDSPSPLSSSPLALTLSLCGLVLHSFLLQQCVTCPLH